MYKRPASTPLPNKTNVEKIVLPSPPPVEIHSPRLFSPSPLTLPVSTLSLLATNSANKPNAGEIVIPKARSLLKTN